ncbi:MAG TPA: hypothetical protein VL403_02805, partial [Candidatus Kryptonia bacterium]|nr:hypothetical protein [Candidatus Kryptonia bacterium]
MSRGWIIALLVSAAMPAAAQTDQMYWNVGTPLVPGAPAPKIQRADLSGLNVHDVVTSGLMAPGGIAIDPIG